MDPKIIALRGRGDIGKTATINLIPGILIEQGWTRIMRDMHGNRIDFIDVYEKDGIKLGVASAGDNYREVNIAMVVLVAEGCTIIICACRTFDKRNKIGVFHGTHSAPAPTRVCYNNVSLIRNISKIGIYTD